MTSRNENTPRDPADEIAPTVDKWLADLGVSRDNNPLAQLIYRYASALDKSDRFLHLIGPSMSADVVRLIEQTGGPRREPSKLDKWKQENGK